MARMGAQRFEAAQRTDRPQCKNSGGIRASIHVTACLVRHHTSRRRARGKWYATKDGQRSGSEVRQLVVLRAKAQHEVGDAIQFAVELTRGPLQGVLGVTLTASRKRARCRGDCGLEA